MDDTNEEQQNLVTVRRVREGFLCVIDSPEVRRNPGDDGLRVFTGGAAEQNLLTNLKLWSLPVKAETREIESLIAAGNPETVFIRLY